MAKIIHIMPSRSGANESSAENKRENGKILSFTPRNALIFERPAENWLIIRARCSDGDKINTALRSLLFGQKNWRLYRAKRCSMIYQPGYITHLIRYVQLPDGYSYDECLQQLMLLLTQKTGGGYLPPVPQLKSKAAN